jgi:hypothetical protein
LTENHQQRILLPLVQSRAMHIIPMPPPMHSVASGIALLHPCSSVTSTRAPEAPNMADRDRAAIDVDLGGIPAEIAIDRAGLRGEASLASIRSRSPMFQPAFFSAARSRDRPVPRSWDRRRPGPTRCGQAFLPSFGGLLGGHQNHHGSAIVMPDALPAVTVPSFSKRLQLASRHGGAMARIFVGADDDVALAGFDGDGDDLVVELRRPSGRPRLFCE